MALMDAKVTRIDWWRVITDLERHGYGHRRVAHECMRSTGWVANLKNIPNTEPRHADGVVVLSLWAAAMSKPVEQAPRVDES